MTNFNYINKLALKINSLAKKLVTFIRIDFFFNVYVAKSFNNFFNKLNFFLFFSLKHNLIDHLNTLWVKRVSKVHFFSGLNNLPWFKLVSFTLISLALIIVVISLVI